MMISQAKIDQQIDQVLAGPTPQMQVKFFLPEELGDEQYITLCRGSKSDFGDVIPFWLKVLQRHMEWETIGLDNDAYISYLPYSAAMAKEIQPLQYSPLSRDEFYSFIDRYPCFKELPQPLSEMLGLIDISDSYLAGVSAWDKSRMMRQTALAEFANEYVAFSWESWA